jgi:hypothetical protein
MRGCDADVVTDDACVIHASSEELRCEVERLRRYHEKIAAGDPAAGRLASRALRRRTGSVPSPPAQTSEIASLLEDHLLFVAPNLNDTFAYACADTEDLAACEQLADAYREHGWHIFVALAAYKRGVEPLQQIADTPEYAAAKACVDADRDLRIFCEVEQATDDDFARWNAERT